MLLLNLNHLIYTIQYFHVKYFTPGKIKCILQLWTLLSYKIQALYPYYLRKWGGGRKNRFYSHFIYNFLDFNHSRRIVSFSSSYLYLYMLAEFLFCFFICSFDFFFIPVSNNMTKKEKLTERYWYVSTILCIWQGTLNTFKRKLIPFLSQLSLLLFKKVPGN